MVENKEMKIGSGRKRVDGVVSKVYGYAPRAGRSLAELLKENTEVKVSSMGGSAASEMVKAIAHAQKFLKEEGKNLVATDFAFETVSVTSTDEKQMPSKVITVLVKLV